MIRLVCCMHHYSLNNESKNNVNRRPQRPYKKTITEEHHNLNSVILYPVLCCNHRSLSCLLPINFYSRLQKVTTYLELFFYFDEKKRNSKGCNFHPISIEPLCWRVRTFSRFPLTFTLLSQHKKCQSMILSCTVTNLHWIPININQLNTIWNEH